MTFGPIIHTIKLSKEHNGFTKNWKMLQESKLKSNKCLRYNFSWHQIKANVRYMIEY